MSDFLVAMRPVIKQELVLAFRNKWILTIGSLFVLTALGLSYFGMVTSGYVMQQDIQRTTASLLSLGLYILPLLALMMCISGLIAHKEHFQLLMTQPVSRTVLLLGKVSGLQLALLVTIAAGLGVPGILIGFRAGGQGGLDYLALILGLVLLSCAFTAIATLVSMIFRRRPMVIGIGLFLWFFFVIFYDMIVMGLAVALPEHLVKSVMIWALIGNPVDLVRVGVLIVTGGADFFGPAGKSLLVVTQSHILVSVIVLSAITAWIILPLLIAARILERQDL